jgi:hypothetical protein
MLIGSVARKVLSSIVVGDKGVSVTGMLGSVGKYYHQLYIVCPALHGALRLLNINDDQNSKEYASRDCP